MQQKSDKFTRTITLPQGFTVTAHSGSMGLPENSVEAMEAGIRAGAQVVEFDLRFTKTGEPVLSHDAPQGKCATLRDAFAFLAAHPGVHANVDVKDTAFLECVEPLAAEMGVLDRIFFTGLNAHDIPTAKEKCPSVPYYLNVCIPRFASIKKLAKNVRALGALGVNISKGSLSLRLTRIFHQQGLLVSVWTIDKQSEAQYVLATRPDNVTTRWPDRIWALLNVEEKA